MRSPVTKALFPLPSEAEEQYVAVDCPSVSLCEVLRMNLLSSKLHPERKDEHCGLCILG